MDAIFLTNKTATRILRKLVLSKYYPPVTKMQAPVDLYVCVCGGGNREGTEELETLHLR